MAVAGNVGKAARKEEKGREPANANCDAFLNWNEHRRDSENENPLSFRISLPRWSYKDEDELDRTLHHEKWCRNGELATIFSLEVMEHLGMNCPRLK
ncbi:hypothetical protein BLNAU_9907 [Blattamonas nauphoetae]|uniref:Uncharacterized protein n=1 Tax=Blattamonas nauphoetae TaxID=2049346 RepID=A0ABQ9XUM0_9EUKA|nr:hypothetical protein BLNAU_9907 [Blattamonas nauphoetae]